MKSLDRNSLDEQTRLVARYVAGDLSRSERADFEAWLVASPQLAAEVEMERRLRRGMASAARRGWLKRDTPVRVSRERRWHMALAATALLTMGLAISLTIPRNGGGESAPSLAGGKERGASPLTVRLSKLRSTSTAPDIKLARTNAPSELRIEPDVVVLTCENAAVELECAGGGVPQTPQYAEYEMDLINRRGSTLAWRSARQQPAMRTELSFTLRDPGNLAAGDYEVVVRGISSVHDEVVGRFWLKVSE
jgi:hypothetical protein